MVCNAAMSDAELIDSLGGPASVAKRLGYPPLGGVQRVQNWKVRGIPARVRLDHPDVFVPTQPTPQAPTGAEASHAG